MKKLNFVFLYVALIFATSCSGPKDPTFEKFENLNVKNASMQNVALTADLVLNNPNPFGCKLKELNLDVLSDKDVELTKIDQTYDTEMAASSTFSIPVNINFSPKKLLDKQESIIGTLLSSFLDKEVTLKFKGSCKVEVMNITVSVPIEYEEAMMLKK